MRARLEELVWLLVDDDGNDVDLVHRAITGSGLNVFLQEVGNGEQAIAYVSGRGRYADRLKYPVPDLVILDLVMPLVSGVEFLQWCRQEELCQRLPVVVLSGTLKTDPERERALKEGAQRLYCKPNRLADWQAWVREVYEFGRACKRPPGSRAALDARPSAPRGLSGG